MHLAIRWLLDWLVHAVLDCNKRWATHFACWLDEWNKSHDAMLKSVSMFTYQTEASIPMQKLAALVYPPTWRCEGGRRVDLSNMSVFTFFSKTTRCLKWHKWRLLFPNIKQLDCWKIISTWCWTSCAMKCMLVVANDVMLQYYAVRRLCYNEYCTRHRLPGEQLENNRKLLLQQQMPVGRVIPMDAL